MHSMYDHASQNTKSKYMLPMCKQSTKISKPKVSLQFFLMNNLLFT